MAKNSVKVTLAQALPWILIIGGLVGLFASFQLTMEKLAIYQNPNHNPSCSINPVLSCGSIIKTSQSSAFGLGAFSVLITIGVSILAGAKFKRWFWLGLNGGALFGIIFVHWLIYQSLYTIGALCMFCMSVWTITWPIFLYVTIFNLRENNLNISSKYNKVKNFIINHHLEILITWYVIIIGLIIHNFWYYWKTLI